MAVSRRPLSKTRLTLGARSYDIQIGAGAIRLHQDGGRHRLEGKGARHVVGLRLCEYRVGEARPSGNARRVLGGVLQHADDARSLARSRDAPECENRGRAVGMREDEMSRANRQPA